MGLVLRGCGPRAAEEDSAEPLPGELLGVVHEPRLEDEGLPGVFEGFPAGQHEGPPWNCPRRQIAVCPTVPVSACWAATVSLLI